LHVTVVHGDGIRTTYSYLAVIRVRRGQAVRGGEVVGLAATMLHIGARQGDTYIDPASLWGRSVGPPAVHLVPLDGGPPGVEAIRVPEPLRHVQPTVDAEAALAGAASDGAATGVGARGG
jgi:murein DD-endopeptidase MepM/ murein hydrolase activator NlpD